MAKRFKQGQLVEFATSPAGKAAYGSGNAPRIGERGLVMPISGRIQIPGPMGGLVYVYWEHYGSSGVFVGDVKVVGKGQEGFKVELQKSQGRTTALLLDRSGRMVAMEDMRGHVTTHAQEMALDHRVRMKHAFEAIFPL